MELKWQEKKVVADRQLDSLRSLLIFTGELNSQNHQNSGIQLDQSNYPSDSHGTRNRTDFVGNISSRCE